MTIDTTKAKNAIASATPQQTLTQLIKQSAKEFKEALPEHMRPERLIRIALTCIRQTPQLTQCTPASFVGALLVSAQLGLEPMAGRAYILPFFNNKTGKTEAQFLVGYKGLADLFYRHAKSVNLTWGVVHKNDEFYFEYGSHANIKHKFDFKDRGDVIAYWVQAELQGGAKPFMVMSKEDCMQHGKEHSKTYNTKTGEFSQYSPWATDPDSMCKKTVLIQLAKLLPLSIDLQRAIAVDETSREYREGIDDALDIPAQDWQTQTGDQKIPPNQAESTISGDFLPKVDETPNQQINRGTITEKQETAIKELAKKRYNEKWDIELLNRVGSQFGLEALCELSTEQAQVLIRELSKEANDAE